MQPAPVDVSSLPPFPQPENKSLPETVWGTNVIDVLEQHGILTPVWWMLLVVVGVLAVAMVVVVPKRQAKAAKYHEASATLENELRRTLIQILGGTVVFVGAYVAWRQLQTTKDNLELARKGQVTDRFSRAVEQLGKPGKENLAIRLGGIYALEQLAADSGEYHWPVVEVLTAYVRENSGWTEPAPVAQKPARKRPLADIQAILTVLGRRNRETERDERLDLSDTNLMGAFLPRAQLEGANLSGGHLEGAFLVGAQLEDAHLEGTHLEGAQLPHAHLEGAHLDGAVLEGGQTNLWGAHLEGANLQRAHLKNAFLINAHLEGAELGRKDYPDKDFYELMTGADLSGALLDGAHLEGANLVDALGLTQEQLNAACVDDKTNLGGTGLERPARRPCCDTPGADCF
jgi:uncharacterized protein YjbI with pentapeptide repeats